MTPKKTTLKVLVDLVSELAINEKTVMVYLYYCVYGDTHPTRKDVQKGTGLALATIRKHEKVLEAIGALQCCKYQGRGKGNVTKAFDLEKHTIPPSSSYIHILDISSQKNIASLILHNKYSKEDTGGYGRFISKDIDADVDWLEAKKYLEVSFKEFELDTNVLAKKNRFAILVELLHEDGFDFAMYCRWYADNKYPDKGFNFGLFLYPKMIAEYRDYMDREGKYLNTSSRMMDNASFKDGVQNTRNFLKGLEDET